MQDFLSDLPLLIGAVSTLIALCWWGLNRWLYGDTKANQIGKQPPGGIIGPHTEAQALSGFANATAGETKTAAEAANLADKQAAMQTAQRNARPRPVRRFGKFKAAAQPNQKPSSLRSLNPRQQGPQQSDHPASANIRPTDTHPSSVGQNTNGQISPDNKPREQLLALSSDQATDVKRFLRQRDSQANHSDTTDDTDKTTSSGAGKKPTDSTDHRSSTTDIASNQSVDHQNRPTSAASAELNPKINSKVVKSGNSTAGQSSNGQTHTTAKTSPETSTDTGDNGQKRSQGSHITDPQSSRAVDNDGDNTSANVTSSSTGAMGKKPIGELNSNSTGTHSSSTAQSADHLGGNLSANDTTSGTGSNNKTYTQEASLAGAQCSDSAGNNDNRDNREQSTQDNTPNSATDNSTAAATGENPTVNLGNITNSAPSATASNNTHSTDNATHTGLDAATSKDAISNITNPNTGAGTAGTDDASTGKTTTDIGLAGQLRNPMYSIHAAATDESQAAAGGVSYGNNLASRTQADDPKSPGTDQSPTTKDQTPLAQTQTQTEQNDNSSASEDEKRYQTAAKRRHTPSNFEAQLQVPTESIGKTASQSTADEMTKDVATEPAQHNNTDTLDKHPTPADDAKEEATTSASLRANETGHAADSGSPTKAADGAAGRLDNQSHSDRANSSVDNEQGQSSQPTQAQRFISALKEDANRHSQARAEHPSSLSARQQTIATQPKTGQQQNPIAPLDAAATGFGTEAGIATDTHKLPHSDESQALIAQLQARIRELEALNHNSSQTRDPSAGSASTPTINSGPSVPSDNTAFESLKTAQGQNTARAESENGTAGQSDISAKTADIASNTTTAKVNNETAEWTRDHASKSKPTSDPDGAKKLAAITDQAAATQQQLAQAQSQLAASQVRINGLQNQLLQAQGESQGQRKHSSANSKPSHNRPTLLSKISLQIVEKRPTDELESA